MSSTKTIYRGDTPLWQFNVKGADGVAMDLTGAEVYFAVKRTLGTPDYLFNKSCTIAAPATSGVVTVRNLTAETTPAGTYLAELEVRYPNNDPPEVYTVDQFTLVIKDDVRKGA